MDPRDRKGKEVASSWPSRRAPYPGGGHDEASSSWMQQQQQRPITPVGWRMSPIPRVDLWDQALLDPPQMRTPEAPYLPDARRYVDVGRVVASFPREAPPPRIPPLHQHTAAPASYYQALVTGARPPMAPSPPPQQQHQQRPVTPVTRLGQIPPVDAGDEAFRVARQMQMMEERQLLEALYLPGAQRDVRVGRVAASRPLEAPAPPPQIPQPHHQFGSQQPRYRWSEASSSGGHISSFDAGADARRLARNSRANPYSQAPVAALRPPMGPSSHTANSSTRQQLYAMDPRNWIDASDSLHPAYIPSTNFDPVPRGDPSSSRQQPPPLQPRYAAPTLPPPPPLQPRYAAPTLPQPPLQFEPFPPPQRYAGREPPIHHHDPRLEEVRSQLRNNTRVLEGLVMAPESSALVVQLLQEGREEMRQLVLEGFVLYAAHSIMGDRQGHAVFDALLYSLFGRHAQLQQIVRAVPNLIWTSGDGMTAVKLLITAVCRQPGLPEQLVDRFVDEGVMGHDRGNELIVHCFTKMDYEATKILVTHALRNFWHMRESSAGSACLVTCFRYARHEEHQHFVNVILYEHNAVTLAMGQHSNFFVQRVLDDGDSEFRRKLVLELMKEVARLSLDHHGSYVVEHCFLNWVELLPLVLTACTALGTRDLEDLVQTRPGNIVLVRLLHTGYDHCRELTLRLADRIDLLISPSVRRNPQSQMVLNYVRRVRYIQRP